MKQIIVSTFIFLMSAVAFAAPEAITVTVDSLANVTGNGSIEACGTAVHKDGIKPLTVTLKHGDSYYTTLTAPNNNWCVVFKRWTYDGHIDVSATTLQNPGALSFKKFPVP